MSLLESIELMQDKKQMALEKKAIEKRDAAIKNADDLLASGEISKELRDKWVVRAHDNYNAPKGNLLEKIGGFIGERIKIAGENIAANSTENKGGSLWNTVGENFRNMKQDDFKMNIPQQDNYMDLSKIPQPSWNFDAINRNKMDLNYLKEKKRRAPKKKVVRKYKRK